MKYFHEPEQLTRVQQLIEGLDHVPAEVLHFSWSRVSFRGIFGSSLIRTLFLFCFFFGSIVLRGLAQPDIRFEHVSIEHDLSSNVVSCIFQDKNGFIWIGTEDGLNRFDGYETVAFRHHPEDTSSISSNWVFCMLQDHQGVIWIGTKTGLNRLDPETGRIQQFLEYRHGSETIRLNDLYVIYEDRQGGLWFGSDRFHRLDPVTGKFSFLPLPAHVSPENLKVYYMQEDNQGRLLAGTSLGLFLIDKETEQLQYLDLPRLSGQQQLAEGIRGFWQNTPDNLWIAGQSDLLQINLTDYHPDILAPGVFTDLDFWSVRVIKGDRAGHIWLGSNIGLNRLNPATGRSEVFVHDPQNPNSIAKGVGEQLFFDRQGSLWIGGEKGLDRLSSKYLNQVIDPEKSALFSQLQIASEGALSDKRKMVRSFLKDRNGNFWIGTYDGLFRYPDQKQELGLGRHFSADPANPHALSGDGIRALLEDRRGDIWVSTTKGLNRIDTRSGQIERITFNQIAPDGLGDAVFWSLSEDEQGNIWVGTMSSGVLCLDPISRQTRHFVQDPEDETTLSENETLKIFQDREGRIWIGTLDGGLNLYRPADHTFSRFLSDPQDSTSISGNIVWSIFQDDQNRIWIGTQAGLNRLIAEKKDGVVFYRFERYMEKDGLVNNTIYSILSDMQGRLWLSTLGGLSCFDPEKKTFLNYGLKDGLQSISFTPNASYKDPVTGEMYFGSTDGYIRFKPEHFQVDTFAPPVVISSLTRFNKTENNGKAIVDYFPAGKRSFRFSYLDDVVTFNLALLNFEQTEKNKYEYQLEGLQSNWIPLGTDRKITFTNLQIGKHFLRIRGANHNGVWTEQETRIAIVVTPPWWWSNLAKILYLVLLAAGLWGIYRYQLRRKLIEQEAKQLKELDEIKSRFFTNISHEFRTPLTVISGMVAQMKQHPEQWMEKGMEIIHRNSNQLLSLINQILDLRKLESGALKVHLIQDNIIAYLHYIADSFVSMAQSKGIRVHFLASHPALEMDFDPEKILQILSNLLSNAIKYTPGPGDIYLQVDRQSGTRQDLLSIQVKDTGPGIPPEALPFIFDRFYRVDPDLSSRPYHGNAPQTEGTGIGLSLTKELVTLLGGTIEAASTLGKGTTFIVNLPITKEAKLQGSVMDPKVKAGPPSANVTAPDTSPAGSFQNAKADPFPANNAENLSGQPTLLIVEDNPDVRLYLMACLERHYYLLTAENGQEGIDRAIEQVPDLIVSDVMMPVKDGFALCNTLKNDERTSHIPLVLLTARADFESKIKGLRKGADAYLAKPFEQEELLVRLEQLLILRKKLQNRYRGAILIPESAPPEDLQMEDAFIKKIREEVLAHISEEDFGILHLQRALHISRTQLHNKIKALTGQSTTELIRTIRLNKARELLLTTDLNVSEVGYEVGISNPAYFSRIYTEEFGEAPRRTRK